MNDPISNDSRKGPPRPTDAIAPIAADSTPNVMEDPNDIGDALTLLAQNGDAVSIYPASGGEVVMARIFSVDPENPHFVIQLNEGSVLLSGDCTFVAWLRNAKLQFQLSNPHWETLPDEPTLIPAEFPERCLVQNRRAFARFETPLGVCYLASFTMAGRQYELQLHDFSMGGVGMRCPRHDAAGLRVGRVLQNVRLDLGEGTEVVCDLEIRLVRRFRSFLAGEQVQIGCQFIDLSPQMQDALYHFIERVSGASQS